MRDDNDRLIDGTLPADPFADTEHFEHADAAGNGRGGLPVADDDDPWPEPVSLDAGTRVPPFPVGALPPWLREWVVALSHSLQCPPDLPAMLALSVLSLTCAKKWRVQVRRPDWPEPLNLYCAVALKSGESKTPSFTAATRPVHRFVAEERKRQDPEIKIATARYDVVSKRIEQLKIRAAKEADGPARDRLMKEMEAAVLEQATIQIPTPLRLILDDVTAESLEQVMRHQGGRAAILSDEGGPFELMGGRYSDQIPNIDVYLKGHSGSAIATDRIGRPGGSIQNPALTIGLAVQPEVIARLQEKRGFRGRGLLARFLWSIPESRVGSRIPDPPAMPEPVRVAYEEAILSLLTVPAEKDDEGEIVPQIIDVEPEAYELIVGLKGEIEPSLGVSGDLETVADWANKMGGTVARIAGLLHLADHAHKPRRGIEPIGAEEMQRALVIGDYLPGPRPRRLRHDVRRSPHPRRPARPRLDPAEGHRDLHGAGGLPGQPRPVQGARRHRSRLWTCSWTMR